MVWAEVEKEPGHVEEEPGHVEKEPGRLDRAADAQADVLDNTWAGGALAGRRLDSNCKLAQNTEPCSFKHPTHVILRLT